MRQYKFQSQYRENFQVVEERREGVSYFPHTDQLPALWKALNQEFKAPLHKKVFGVNAQSDDYHKIVLRHHVFAFCHYTHAIRPDHLRLFCLLNPDKVAKIAIVQQITEYHPKGLCHRFRFYAGDDFFPEIRLSGKRIAFSNHALGRYVERTENMVAENLADMFNTFYAGPIFGMKVNGGQALICLSLDGFTAFTYKEKDTEYFITTCLSMNEIRVLEYIVPADAHNLHYADTFTPPKIRNWNPYRNMVVCKEWWLAKKPIKRIGTLAKLDGWPKYIRHVKTILARSGHRQGSQLNFCDDIPGPSIVEINPSKKTLLFDEEKLMREAMEKHRATNARLIQPS